MKKIQSLICVYGMKHEDEIQLSKLAELWYWWFIHKFAINEWWCYRTIEIHSMNNLIEFLSKRAFCIDFFECRAKPPAAPLGDSRSRWPDGLARWHTHTGQWTLRASQSERLLFCQGEFEATEFQRQTWPFWITSSLKTWVCGGTLCSSSLKQCATPRWSLVPFFPVGSALRLGQLSYHV